AVVADEDEAVRSLGATTRREALGELAPRRDEVLATATTLGLALTATVGVIDRVHGDTADTGTTAEPAFAAGLAERQIHVLAVAHLADRRAALRVDQADLARRKLELGVTTVDTDELHRGAGRTRDLRALARKQFDTVDPRC